MKKLPFILLLLIGQTSLYAQDIRVYHGRKSESFFLKPHDPIVARPRQSVEIIRKKDGFVTIAVINPNPFFYSYEIKTEDVEIKDDYADQFSALVKMIMSAPEVTEALSTGRAAPRKAVATDFDLYWSALTKLSGQINAVKDQIQKSDAPESVKDAFDGSTRHGFRAAAKKVDDQPRRKGDFNSPTLEKDLNDMLDAAIATRAFDTSFCLTKGLDPVLCDRYLEAFRYMNASLASTVI
ncbi:MAG: hypothetical protein JO301_07075, partial [Chitinophagaceae bacterium]|nr:hypothetical protein [Chitinophagaceae bacterium]